LHAKQLFISPLRVLKKKRKNIDKKNSEGKKKNREERRKINMIKKTKDKEGLSRGKIR